MEECEEADNAGVVARNRRLGQPMCWGVSVK